MYVLPTFHRVKTLGHREREYDLALGYSRTLLFVTCQHVHIMLRQNISLGRLCSSTRMRQFRDAEFVGGPPQNRDAFIGFDLHMTELAKEEEE